MLISIRFIAILALIFFNLPLASASSKYLSYLNGFGVLSAHGAEIRGNHLYDSNTSLLPKVNIDTVSNAGSSFNLYVRIANKNNREGKRYKVVNPHTGKRQFIANTTWGAVWNYTDSANYYAVRLQAANSNLHDLLDKRSVTLEVIRLCNGTEQLLSSRSLGKEMNLYDGFNVISIKYDGSSTTISAGCKELHPIAVMNDITYQNQWGYGYLAGPGATIALERTAIAAYPLKSEILATEWTRQSLDTYLSGSRDAYEGYWDYLDRDLNEKKLKLGGRYALALVKNADGYNIIYIDGAQVNNAAWHTGMLKGKLTLTPIQDNYNLVWYDSMLDAFTQDVYAGIENGALLTLYFPVQGSKLRFVKRQ